MKQKIILKLKVFFKHELISGSSYLFLGGLVSNFLNFLFNLFLARSLSYSDYATFASLVSLIILLSLPSQSLTTVFIRFATDYITKKEKHRSAKLYFVGMKIFSFLGLGFFLFLVLFSSFLSGFLKIDNHWYFVIIGLIIATSYVNIVNVSFLTSLLKFKFISAMTLFSSFIKLVTGVSLILIGWKVFGALGALLASFLLPFIVSFIPLKSIFSTKPGALKLDMKKLASYTLPASVTVISLSSFTSTDVILVKHFFRSDMAGIYAGISLIGKVIFYFTAPISSVMFPLLIKRFNSKENVSSLLYMAVILVFTSSVAISCFYFMFPKFVIGFFLGGKEYLKASSILGLFGIFISIFSVLSVLVNFFLSLNKTKVAYLVAAGALAQIVLIQFFHKNFFQIVILSISITLLLLIVILLYYAKAYGAKEKPSKKIDIAYNSSL